MPGETELLRHIYRRSADLAGHPCIALGPGDDAALLHLPAATLVTVDQLVEGRHYRPDLDVDLVARKAVARSVSDIAAMGGRPLAGFATACLRSDFREADHLFDRMSHWARCWAAPLAGGDIATGPGPTVLTVTMLGELPDGVPPVLRSGARAGDRVVVTGALGGSLASGRHARFEPRLAEAAWLQTHARPTAMLDISDGLGRDAGRLAEASGVRIVLEAARLPRHAEVADWRRAASDGEDYELL
ncbi:MAG: thiamine-monophosphate kinase, partial [Phycisphaerales bacterium]|nr:thiamine-monophosphate kinase [Phycisphaerales bacterium]